MEAQLHDGTILEFPDGTDPAIVQSTVKRYLTKQQAAVPLTADPTQGMSSVDKFLAGAGKSLVDMARGGGQWLGLVDRGDVAESRRLDAPLMKSGAGMAGNIAGSVATLAPTAMIPGANTIAGAGLLGSLFGALQPSTSGTETALNIGLGGAGGAGGQKLGNMLGSWAQGTRQTPAQQQVATAADALGFKMTPGQATGSKALQKIEAALESNPMTGRPFDRLRENNQQVLNRVAAKAIGENADNLGSDVLGRANARLGSVFDKVADATPVPLDPLVVGGRLKQVLADTEGLIGQNASLADNALFKRLDSFVNEAGGATREQLRNLSSKLGRAAYNNMTGASGDRELGKAMFALKSTVDEQVLGTLQGAAKAEFSDAMAQYAKLMQLTGRIGTINPATGNVSGKNLANLLQQKDRSGYLFGGNQSDLYNAARFAKAFPDVVNNSGTATRSLGPTDWLMSLPGSVASSAYLSAPSQALFRGTTGGAGAAAGLLGNPRVSLPGGMLSGTGLSGLLSSYFDQ